eukprot:CAMPEP_0118930980 /NCGR_PEP_ID=MMETSP1169-20130426/7483_1 /TAXON_ID=36882 /ORGANISM="Pyramimonas obovata, Strain CCMP722" /LENGTH=74 /DNA_ID=CAMNT_0006873423 /DNA_START=283 /DNA_END=504 /DNA_ORIENTATION=+
MPASSFGEPFAASVPGVLRDTRATIPPAPEEDPNFRAELDLLFSKFPPAVVQRLRDTATNHNRDLYTLVEIYVQ